MLLAPVGEKPSVFSTRLQLAMTKPKTSGRKTLVALSPTIVWSRLMRASPPPASSKPPPSVVAELSAMVELASVTARVSTPP